MFGAAACTPRCCDGRNGPGTVNSATPAANQRRSYRSATATRRSTTAKACVADHELSSIGRPTSRRGVGHVDDDLASSTPGFEVEHCFGGAGQAISEIGDV